MKLTYNISAVIANNQLKSTENRLAKSTERLSSGYKINRSSDDPSGLAISRKLREQIRGLDNASQNSLDGISVLQSAEGGLTEINSMLQRMRELTVQALNGTYTLEDKENIQNEVDELTEEIDRIVSDTEFNGQTLLNGNLAYQAYTDTLSVNVTAYSTSVASQDYVLNVTKDPEKAVVMDSATSFVNITTFITAAQAGTITINGVEVEITEGDTPDEVYAKLRDGAKIGDVDLFSVSSTTTATSAANTLTPDIEDSAGFSTVAFANGSTKLLFVAEEYGSDSHVNISCDNTALMTALGLNTIVPVNAATGIHEVDNVGTDAEISFTSGFTSTATYSADGDKVTITDCNGFEMKLSVAGDTISSLTPASTSLAVTIEATGMGAMILQVGASEDQAIDIVIPDVSVKALGIDNLNMLGTEGLNRSLEAIDNALSTITAVRGLVGTYSNRLESTSSSIDSTTFNLEEAYSRIMDTDMAEEMTAYTKDNVLSQAGTSILAQANEKPQTVLQLLS